MKRTTVLKGFPGIDSAMGRAHAYVEASADATFLEAPRTVEDIARVAFQLKFPQTLDLVHGGLTPSVDGAELARLGYSATLYANAALQGALHAVAEVFGQLRDVGSLEGTTDRLASFDSRQQVAAKDFQDELESRYR